MHTRYCIMQAIILAAAGLLIMRLVAVACDPRAKDLADWHFNSYTQEAVAPQRGPVFDCRKFPLSQQGTRPSAYANPRRMAWLAERYPGRTKAFVAALSQRANETYISPNMLAGSIVYELCRSGALDTNIGFVNAQLALRRDAVVESLRERIPEARFVVPGGGYFLWLDLAEGSDTQALVPLAKEEGVAFIGGPDFMLEGGHESLRLSFASVPPEQVPEGIGRLARALERQRV